MKMKLKTKLGTCLILLSAALNLFAHDPGLSSGQLHILPGRVEAELTFSRTDIESIVQIDTDNDGVSSPAEQTRAYPALETLARDAWSIKVDGLVVRPEATDFLFDGTDNVHLTSTFQTGEGKSFNAQSVLIDRLPRGHRQFITLLDASNRVVLETLLSAGQNEIFAEVNHIAKQTPPSRTQVFRDFLKLGFGHILAGYDHLLFLFALLIIAPQFRQAALIITSFTIAHSISLALATLNLVNFQSRMVEPLIAASIIYVGVENLVRRESPRGRWLLTFVFGLVHGLGFAGALHERGVGSGASGIAVPLVSFNLGVEIGQIFIAAAILPLIWQARKTEYFNRYGPAFCSIVVIALGAWWFAERTIL